MSSIRLEYEILVSGIYPFEGHFEKNGFTMVTNLFDVECINSLVEKGVIYLNPLFGICCINDSNGNSLYLTLRKSEQIEVDYPDGEEYSLKYTNQYLRSINIWESVNFLEKSMVLEINNDIKFPVKMVKVYDMDNKLITIMADIMKLNVPTLIGTNQERISETVKRQINRLSSGFSYNKLQDLASNNVYFKNALSMYHASFSVSDHQVGFTLLVISLESMLGLDTYGKPETCRECKQKKYKITATISENVSYILKDQDDSIKRKMKNFYSMRSKYVHSGKFIEEAAEQELQEYVRKVILMYWYTSMYRNTYDHKELMSYLRSDEYKVDAATNTFLIALENKSFEERKRKIVETMLLKK